MVNFRNLKFGTAPQACTQNIDLDSTMQKTKLAWAIVHISECKSPNPTKTGLFVQGILWF
jgi:hypothetical protein